MERKIFGFKIISGGGGNDKQLEQKLLQAQEELTELYKKKSEVSNISDL